MKNKKLWIFIGMIVLIAVLNQIFGWSSYIGDINNLSFLKRIVEENLAIAVLLYIVFTIVGCVVLALPGVTFAILAGLLFGSVLGTICCSVATTIGAVLAFIVGRYFLKDSIKPLVVKNKYLKKWLFDSSGKNELFVLMITRLVPIFPYNLQNFAYGITDIKFSKNKYLKKWLFDSSGKNELFVLMITRLVPIFPYNLQNFAYGITDIKFSIYTIGSFLFMLPGTVMYTVGTAGLTDGKHRVLYLGIAVLLAVIVMGVGFFLKKRYIGEDKDE